MLVTTDWNLPNCFQPWIHPSAAEPDLSESSFLDRIMLKQHPWELVTKQQRMGALLWSERSSQSQRSDWSKKAVVTKEQLFTHRVFNIECLRQFHYTFVKVVFPERKRKKLEYIVKENNQSSIYVCSVITHTHTHSCLCILVFQTL